MASIPTVSRSEFQELFRRVEGLYRLKVERESGLELSKGHGGVSIRKSKTSGGFPKARSLAIIPVAITTTIEDDDTSLTVREVDYSDSPPGDTLYFKGDSFTAYPYWGDVTATDYQGFEFTGETPTSETRVFDARKRGNDWIVERPSSEAAGAVRVGKLVDIITDGSKVGRIQPYKVDDSGLLVVAGPVVTRPYFPGFLGFQFARHQAFQLVVALVTLTDGQEYIQQTMPWFVKAESATTISRCAQ